MVSLIEKDARKRGHADFLAGVPREKNPEFGYYSRQAWDLGWEIASEDGALF